MIGRIADEEIIHSGRAGEQHWVSVCMCVCGGRVREEQEGLISVVAFEVRKGPAVNKLEM